MKDFKDETKKYFEPIEEYENRIFEQEDLEEVDEYDEIDEDLPDPTEEVILEPESNAEEPNQGSEDEREAKPFDKEKFSSYKRKEREDCYELIEDTLNKIVNGESKKLEDLLRVMAQFETYSLNNCILIASQYPNAKHLKTYSEWKERQVNVLRGSQTIKILAPKRQAYNGEDKTFINVKNVYDESQTTKDKSSKKPKINDESIYEALAKLTDIRVVKVDSEDIGYRVIDQDFKTVYIKANQPSHLLNITTLNTLLEAKTLSESEETKDNTKIISNYDNFINECINFVFANRYYQNSTFTEFFIVKVNFEKLTLSIEELKEALKKVRYYTKKIFQAIYVEDREAKRRLETSKEPDTTAETTENKED